MAARARCMYACGAGAARQGVSAWRKNPKSKRARPLIILIRNKIGIQNRRLIASSRRGWKKLFQAPIRSQSPILCARSKNKPAQICILGKIADVLINIGGVDLHSVAGAVGGGK